MLRDAINALLQVGCMKSSTCRGAKVPPRNMQTCNACSVLWRAKLMGYFEWTKKGAGS